MRLSKRKPEIDGVSLSLRSTETGDVELRITADEATIAQVFEALNNRC